MKQLTAFRKRHATLDYTFMMVCAFAIVITMSTITRNSSIADTLNIINFPKSAQSSFEVAVRQTVVVSTTVPNESDFVVAESIQAEARRQETLEERFAEEIAERERLLEEQRIAEEKQAFQDYINSIVCDPSDISRVSGLKEEDYGLLTKGTWWEGNEQTLYELETEHGVNAMFAISVSSLESGLGTSVRASSRHNYYGIELDRNWSSLYDNTLWWGGMINRVYIENGLCNVYDIGPVYCPPNREWEVYMNDRMNSLYNSLINNLQSTIN